MKLRLMRVDKWTSQRLKSAWTAGAGSTGTVRSTQEDALPEADPNRQILWGNQYRYSAQAIKFKQLNIHVGKHLRRDKIFTCN